MKNIRKSSLFAVFVSVLFVAGCGKDPVLTGLTCFLNVASFISTNGRSDLKIIYGSDGKVSGFEISSQDGQDTFVTTVTATYDGNGRISQFDLSGGSRYEYTYDANGNVTREDSYEDEELYTRTEYAYNSSGQLIREDTYYPQSGVPDDAYSETYQYANTSGSNPTRSTSIDPSGTSYGYVEYEYDDKPTPYSELNLPLGVSGAAGSPTNNVTKRTSKNNAGAVGPTTAYTYQYNADGYPTSVAVTTTFPGSPNTNTHTETYTYDCK